MAELNRAPICETSWLPLPILPRELAEKRALFTSNDNLCEREDYHHLWSPERHYLLQGLGGRALRYSLGEDINRSLHNRFNKTFEKGPVLPTNDDERFVAVLFGCSDVLPRQAVHLPWDGGHEIVELSDDEHRYIGSKVYPEKQFHQRYGFARRKSIGRFFAHYLLSQTIDYGLSESKIGEFIDTRTSDHRRKELGNQIITNVIGDSVSHLVPVHAGLKQEGFVTDERIYDLGKTVRSFFTKNHYQDYHLALRGYIEHA